MVNARLPIRVPSTSIDQIMSMENDTMDGQARILVYFRGHVDEERLARAVRLSIEAEPILGYRFVNDPRRPYWQRVDEKDWVSIFSMTERSPSDPELYEFMVDPVLPERAPQVKVGLFRSEDDLLCIRTNHMIVDGGGGIQYLALLSSIYRELEKDPLYRPRVNPSGRPGPRQVLKQVGLLSAIRALPKTRVPGAAWGVKRTSDDLSKKTFMIRQIGPERLSFLRSYAREKGVTLNDVLLTAFCRSLFVICDPPMNQRLRVEVPTNLRRYLPAERAGAIGDISAVYFIAIDRRNDQNFEETLKRVHREMDKKKKDRTELAEMLLLELVLLPGIAFVKRMKELAIFKIAHPVLSNLGVIDPGAVDFGTIPVEDVRPMGPTQFTPNIGLGVSTFRQRMTLSLSYCSSAMDPKTMDRFLELFLDQLPGRPVTPDNEGGSGEAMRIEGDLCDRPELAGSQNTVR
jgi:NRPS condensation-like uncharacterized protein